MKLEYIDEDNFIIYLNNYYIKELNCNEQDKMEAYFKKIFLNLKNNYFYDIYGYYSIRVYIIEEYGLIIDVLKLNNKYLDIYNRVDMKVIVENDNKVLYELEDYFFIKEIRDMIKNIYYKDNKYYIELNDKIKSGKYNLLLEHSRLIYDDKVYDILMSGKKCNNNW